jgi:hypothetical protein
MGLRAGCSLAITFGVGCINLSRKIGLKLNFNKCETFCSSGDTDLKVIKEFQNLAPGIKICDRRLLGSPIFDQRF